MVNSSILDLIRRIPLFEGVSEKMLERLADQFRKRDFPANHTLFYEGDEGGSLFVVVEGTLAVQRVNESGATLHLADRGPGEHVGELSLIDDSTRSADVVARSNVSVLILNRKEFEKAVLESPELGLNMMKSLAKRLREQSERVSKHSSLDVLGRLSMALLELNENGKVTLSQRFIADRIGTTRESVNRSLSQLAELEVIEMKKGQIVIKKKDFLVNRSRLN